MKFFLGQGVKKLTVGSRREERGFPVIGVMIIVLLVALLVVATFALIRWQPQQRAVTTTKEIAFTWPKDVPKPETLWKIQPGLGVLMPQMGNRMWVMYYAAKAGNWNLATLQVEELEETLEVAEVTRPKRADALKIFKEKYLEPLLATVEAKDFVKFKTAFNNTVTGCNGCHARSQDEDFPSHSFIKWKLPEEPPPFYDVTAK